jgi:hypothetical protein
MRITQYNSEAVTQWLLQCDYEDFNGPLDLLAEQYSDLYEVYRQRIRRKKRQEDNLNVGITKMTRLARNLYAHLNRQAKASLEEKIVASVKKG